LNRRIVFRKSAVWIARCGRREAIRFVVVEIGVAHFSKKSRVRGPEAEAGEAEAR